MKAFFIVPTLLMLTACNSDNIEKTKALNKNNALLATGKTAPLAIHNTPTQKERVLKMEYQNRIALNKIENSNQQKLATINAQKEQKLKELDLEKQKAIALQKTQQKAIEANNSLALAKIKSSTLIQIKTKETSFYTVAAFIALALMLFWLLLRYINQQSKRRHEAHLKEQDLHYQAYMEESKMKHQNISKMLDIISDEKSDAGIKKEMAKILTYNKNSLIQHKRK